MTYFDVGCSYGITDRAFVDGASRALPAIGMVGLRNPLGNGVERDIRSSPAAEAWRQEAIRQVRRPEMETGWDRAVRTREDFDDLLEQRVAEQPIARCEITLYATGTVYLHLEFAPGVDVEFVHGLLTCFEFAAYRPEISQLLRDLAASLGEEVAQSGTEVLADLTRRPEPEVIEDAGGYRESRLFSAFSNLILMTDPGDTDLLAGLLTAVGPEDPEHSMIRFEYHGQLYYDWSGFVIVPRDHEDDPRASIERMLECIQIAHVALGACEALLALFSSEITVQVESYVSSDRKARGPEQLKQLRALALAVVSLTNLARVTPSGEDQDFFARFAKDAKLVQTQQFLSESVDLLYNVQEAEVQEQRATREQVLNVVVLVLASLTLISVTADAYNFVGQNEPLVGQRALRLQFLTEFVLVLVLLVFMLVRFISRVAGYRRRRRRR